MGRLGRHMILLPKNVRNGCPILANRNKARQLFHWDLHSPFPATPTRHPPSPQANLISCWWSQARPAGRRLNVEHRDADILARFPGCQVRMRINISVAQD